MQAQVVGRRVRFRVLQPLRLPGHRDLLLMQLFQRIGGTGLEFVLALLAILHLPQQLFQFILAGSLFFRQFLQFPFPGKEVHVSGGNGTAGHGTAGVHHVALKGDQAESMIAPAHDRDTGGQVLRHHRASKQVLHDPPVVLIAGNQV